jgi:hypothetical protein
VTAYEKTHSRLKEAYGPAKGHCCVSCGGPALDWALQYQHPERIVWEKPKPYSEDLDDYAPMCRGCHFVLDLAVSVRDKDLLDAARRENLALAREAMRKKFDADPVYKKTVSAIRQQNAAVARKSLRLRRCGGCPMVTMPGALGKHQGSSGHVGWVAV